MFQAQFLKNRGDKPVQYQDRRDKDLIVKQVQIMGDIIHRIPIHEQELKELQKSNQFDQLQFDHKSQINKSEEGQILMTETLKVIHLKNKDTKQDLAFQY